MSNTRKTTSLCVRRRATGPVWPILILLLGGLSSGCLSVAASAAGGALTAVGLHSLQNTSEQTVSMPLAQVEQVTKQVLRRMAVGTAGVTQHCVESATTRYDFECCLLGDELIPVDIRLEELTPEMTKIRVVASRGMFRPELETADEIIAEIVKEVKRLQSLTARPAMPPGP